MQLSPFIFTLATFSVPYHHWNGSRFRKGVCDDDPMPPEPPFGCSLWHSLLLEGSGLPSLSLPPSFPFNCFLSLAVFMSGQLQIKVFRAAAMIAVPFIHLDILHCSSQLDDEFFHHSLDSIGVIAFWVLTIMCIFFFQLCQAHGRFLGEWLTAL